MCLQIEKEIKAPFKSRSVSLMDSNFSLLRIMRYNKIKIELGDEK